MTTGKSTTLRIAGILVFLGTIATSLEMLSRAIGSWVFMIEYQTVGWGLFYVLTSMLFSTFFIMTAFAAGLSAIFAGKEPYTQAIWNCSFYGILCVSLFAGFQAITGITEDDRNIFLVSVIAILVLIVFMVVEFFCLRKEENFYWKNFFKIDKGMKLCLKVWGIMLALIVAGTFIYANKMIEG